MSSEVALGQLLGLIELDNRRERTFDDFAGDVFSNSQTENGRVRTVEDTLKARALL